MVGFMRVDSQNLFGSVEVLEPFTGLHPTQVEIFIHELIQTRPDPSRYLGLSRESKCLQLLLIMSLDCISRKLLCQLLDVSLPLLVIV